MMNASLSKIILGTALLLVYSCAHQGQSKRTIATSDSYEFEDAKQKHCAEILSQFAEKKLTPDQIPTNVLNELDAKASQLSFSSLSPLNKRRTSEIEKTLKYGKIIRKDLHDVNANSTYLVTFADGTQAIWKPHLLSWSSNYRTEVLSYEFDRKFKFNLVPPTVERTIDDQKGSLQLFMKSRNKYFDESEELKQKYLSGMKKMFLFDYLTEQRDRSSDNFLASLEADVIAIDNGMSFTGQGHSEFATWEFRKEFITDFLKTDEGKRIINELRHLDVDRFRAEIEAYIGKKDTDRLFERINFIIQFFDQL